MQASYNRDNRSFDALSVGPLGDWSIGAVVEGGYRLILGAGKPIRTDVSQGVRNMSHDINVLALVKGAERYIFLYNDENRSEVLRTLGRYASNPDLSFSWYDAAVLSQKVRQTAAATTPAAAARRFELPLSSDQLED